MSKSATDSDEKDFVSTVDVAQTMEGVKFDGLNVGDVLEVATLYSIYRFVLNDPSTGQVEVSGGSVFTKPIHAVLTGSPLKKGSTSIRPHWVYLGESFEVQYLWGEKFEAKVLHSSAVRRIAVNGHVVLPCFAQA